LEITLQRSSSSAPQASRSAISTRVRASGVSPMPSAMKVLSSSRAAKKLVSDCWIQSWSMRSQTAARPRVGSVSTSSFTVRGTRAQP
jgi:hypothetical protein